MKKAIYLIGVILIISIVIFYYYNNLSTRDSLEKVKLDFEKDYSSIKSINEKYYRSIEFYPWYDRYIRENRTRNGTYGYGAYPGEVAYDVYGFDTGQYVEV